MRTPQYRYSEYVRLQDPDLMTQEPDWDSPVGWGELYDLFEAEWVTEFYRVSERLTKKYYRIGTSILY